MLRARHSLAAMGTGVALMTALGGPAIAASATAPGRGRPTQPRAYLIHLIDGGDPIVVKNYTEQDGQIRFEKFGGWVAIPSYEVRRIVPDDSDDGDDALPPPAVEDPGTTALRRHTGRRECAGDQGRWDRGGLGGPRQHPGGLAHPSPGRCGRGTARAGGARLAGGLDHPVGRRRGRHGRRSARHRAG